MNNMFQTIVKKICLLTIISLIASVSILVYVDSAYAFDPDGRLNHLPFQPTGPSLKEQLSDNILLDEILCGEITHILVERHNGKIACVSNNTAEKLNWQLVRSEIADYELWSIQHCGLDSYDNYQTNNTHTFLGESCLWAISKTHN